MERYGMNPLELEECVELRPRWFGEVLAFLGVKNEFQQRQLDPKMGEELDDEDPDFIQHWAEHRKASADASRESALATLRERGMI